LIEREKIFGRSAPAGALQHIHHRDIYAHFLKKADQAAAERLDNLMTRRKKDVEAKRATH
jgi:hypothetical protein